VNLLKKQQAPSAPGATLPDFGFHGRPDDVKIILEAFLNIMLFNRSQPSRSGSEAPAVSQGSNPTSPLEPLGSALVNVPAGMSRHTVDFITNNGKAAWKSSNQELAKLKVIIAGCQQCLALLKAVADCRSSFYHQPSRPAPEAFSGRIVRNGKSKRQLGHQNH
jgi:hypothetical protein